MSDDSQAEEVVAEVRPGQTKAGSPMLKIVTEGGEAVTFFKDADVGVPVAPGDVVQFTKEVKGQYVNGKNLAVVRRAGARTSGAPSLEATLLARPKGQVPPAGESRRETEVEAPSALRVEALLTEIRDSLRAIARHLGVK